MHFDLKHMTALLVALNTVSASMSYFSHSLRILQHLVKFYRIWRVEKLWPLKSLKGWILSILSDGGVLGWWWLFGKRAKKYVAWYKKKLYFLWFLYVFWPILNSFTGIHFFCPKSRFCVIGPKRFKISEFRWCSATVNSILMTFFHAFYIFCRFHDEL